ncbi:MAG: protein kinase [Deferribacteraceae bacterium]|nr:protein kinase [Deferribacteraceae bacterium]
MNHKFQNLTGQVISAKSGNRYTVAEIAGNGSQGVVYKEISGKHMIKLYYPSDLPHIGKDIIEKLSFVQNVKKPKNFVKIHDLIEKPYIGYIMDRVTEHKSLNSYLIPDSNKSFADWYNSGHGFRGRLIIGYIIAKAFRMLSADNLSYCDISGNNILVKVNSREASVRMIDIDNIYIAGRGNTSVLGTPRYIAPEIISRAKNPDLFSDNYSLAVLLFELLRIGHPYVSDEILDGTPEDEETAYAGKAEYVTDTNSSNMLPSDIAFTGKLKELFERCFVAGKINRMERPSAKDFEFAFLEASNKIIKCPSCGAWHYPRKIERKYLPCPWCNGESEPKAYLNFIDRLYSEIDKNSKSLPQKLSEKLVTSYILREGKNQIKSFYVLRADFDYAETDVYSANYVTIVKVGNEYHLYNEFDKEGICVKPCNTEKFQTLGQKGDIVLNSGDEIYFGVCNKKATKISCEGKSFNFIRIAKFATR